MKTRKVRHQKLRDQAYDQVLRHLKNTLAQIDVNFDVWFSEKSLHDSNAVSSVIAELESRESSISRMVPLALRQTEFW